MALFRNENPILGPSTQVTWNDGTLHYLAGDSAASFTGSAVSNPHAIDAEPSFASASVAVTGSASAIRGNLTVPAATTITSGFLYGTQGKLSIKGSVTTANFIAGLVGQLDLSATVALSGGPVSAIWGDMGASLSSAAAADKANLNILQLTNTAVSNVNAAIFIEANSDFLLDVSNSSYSPWFTNSAPTTLSGSLKIKTSAGTRYLALYTTQ